MRMQAQTACAADDDLHAEPLSNRGGGKYRDKGKNRKRFCCARGNPNLAYVSGWAHGGNFYISGLQIYKGKSFLQWTCLHKCTVSKGLLSWEIQRDLNAILSQVVHLSLGWLCGFKLKRKSLFVRQWDMAYLHPPHEGAAGDPSKWRRWKSFTRLSWGHTDIV